MARTSGSTEEIAGEESAQNAQEGTKNVQGSQAAPSKAGFFQYLTEFTPAQWEQLLVYVYRLLPITDRLATGNMQKYVMKYGGPFDEDGLKVALGSGRYRLQLNQIDAKGHSKTIKMVEVEIEDPNFPPKVPDGEWLDDPRNKRWGWGRKKPEAESPAATAPQETWTPERVVNMMERLRPKETKEDQVSITREVLNAVKETRAELGQANNPAGIIGMLKDLIVIAKPPGQEKPAGEDPIHKLLFESLSQARTEAADARKSAEAERQRNHELQLKMLEAKATAGDPMDMVEKVLNLQAKLGGGESRNWKEKLVDEGMQHVPAILELGKQAFSYRRTAPAQPQPQRPQQPQPGTQQPPTQENSQQQQTQPPAGANPMPEQTITDPDIAFLVEIFEQHGHRLVQAFGSDPDCGGDVADAMAMPFLAGPAGYKRIRLMGPEKILESMKLVAGGQMYKDLLGVGTEQMLREFIADFIDPPEDDDPEPPVDNPPGPVAAPRKKKGPVTA